MVFKIIIIGFIAALSGTFIYDIWKKQPIGSTVSGWSKGMAKGLTEIGGGISEFGVGYQKGISAFLSPQITPKFKPEIEIVPKIGIKLELPFTGTKNGTPTKEPPPSGDTGAFGEPIPDVDPTPEVSTTHLTGKAYTDVFGYPYVPPEAYEEAFY